MKKLAIILVAALFMTACSSITTTVDYDKTVDFTQFKTYGYYGWAQDSDKILNQFDKKRIEQAFAHEFDIRGLEYAEDGAEVIISLFIVVNQETATTAYSTYYGGGYGGYGGYYGYGPGWGWGGGYASTSYHQYDYNVGTLVCDIFEVATKNLIWQGVASGTIDDNPKNRDRRVTYIVSEIMAQYPVKPVKK
jgi:hypothetical protein